MNVDEEDLVGLSLDQVPKRDPTDEHCMGRRSEGSEGEKTFLGYCRATPGRGTDHVGEGRCKHHGGKDRQKNGDAGAPEGEANGNYEHGGYIDHIVNDLSGREERAFQALVEQLRDGDDSGGPIDVIREQAVEAYLRYKRSGDARFLREYRQLLSEFNVLDASDQVEVEHSGSVDVDAELDEQTRAHLDELTGMVDE